MKSYKQYKKEALNNPVLSKEYKALQAEYDLIQTIIQKRIERGWTQKDLAEAIGSGQPVISRLESGAYNPSVKFLNRLAQAFGLRLRISVD